jgi:hypothetical protein
MFMVVSFDQVVPEKRTGCEGVNQELKKAPNHG